jgi:hypothetical protein
MVDMTSSDAISEDEPQPKQIKKHMKPKGKSQATCVAFHIYTEQY